MRKLSRRLFLSVAFVGAMMAGMADAGAEIVIKFSHVVSPKNHPKGLAAQAFADCVNGKESLKGKARVEVYPNSQLYNDNKVLEALLLGDVQMAAPSLSKFERFTLKYRVFDLPFLFEDLDAVLRFMKSEQGRELLRAMEDKGLVGLDYWINGMKQLSANRPLLTPEDAKGLKFRIQQSDVLQAQFETLGAVPQKMAFAEVYGALQQGVVDGQENTWTNIYTKKFYEVQDGITESNHGIISYLVVTSKEFWEGLADDVRKEVRACLDEATELANSTAERLNQESKQKIIESGVEVRELTPEQRQAWIDAMKPVWDKFKDDIGEDVIQAALAANRK